jgi:hypothetical protein
MHAHIDKCLLVEEGLVNVTNHLFRDCFDTEASSGLDEFGALWEITGLFQLVEVLLVLALVFGVRDLFYVIIHNRFELIMLHGLSESLKLVL